MGTGIKVEEEIGEARGLNYACAMDFSTIGHGECFEQLMASSNPDEHGRTAQRS
jgi:hypothetical protein